MPRSINCQYYITFFIISRGSLLKAEIISVGTELLLGHTINRDAAIIGRLLAECGIDLMRVQTVGDNAGRLAEALALAAASSDIIITTGGLGPTDDDLTKSVVADFAGRPLVERPEALASLKEYFGDRPMCANQLRQALLPSGAVMFANTVGTAPGCAVPFNSGQIIMLPGPPSELEAMIELSLKPFLQALSGSIIHSTILRTFGIGEGAAAGLIQDLMAGTNPTVAPYAHNGEMFVKITAKASDRAVALALCEPVVAEVRARLGELVYGQDVSSLEEVVLTGLVANGLTIATAESCTGGLLAKRLTDRPGASEAFQLGLVTYSNESKQRLLHVPAELLAKFGAVSQQTAEAMARNVRALGQASLGIGITGIAGPDGGTREKPVGLVHIALATETDCYLRELRPLGRYLGREWVRERAASTALDMVRRYLAGLPIQAAS